MMENYYIYEVATGKIIQTGACLAPDIELQRPPAGYAVALGEAKLMNDYRSVTTGAVVPYPARPSQFHSFDFASETWALPDTALYDAQVAKKTDVDKLRAEKSVEPILYAGSMFDADETSQSNVRSWMINIAAGATVPDGFMWRDEGNIDHPADENFINGLGAAMVARGSALYKTAWAHKAAIDSLTTSAEVEAYAIDGSW